MSAETQILAAKVEAGFDAIGVRLDEHRELATQRHQETSHRLETIETECRKTNGRVTKNEERIRSLWMYTRQPRKAETHEPSTDAEKDTVTVGRLKWYVVCVSGGFGSCLWLMHALGKF